MSRRVIVALAMCALAAVALLFLHQRREIERLEREVVSSRAKAYELEVDARRSAREAEAEAFRREDSIRQATIDRLFTDNRSRRERAKKGIEALRGATDAYRDSVWTSQWAAEEKSILDQ